MTARLAARTPLHFGWVIVVFAIAGNTIGAGSMFWAIAVYVPRVAEDFAVGRTTIVAAFMLGQTVFALVGPLTGRYIDRHGARGVLLAGAVLCPLAIAVTSRSTVPWQLYAGWMAVGVFRTMVFPLPYNWVITRWFEGRRRQGALGVATTGFGLGGALVLPILAAVAARWDWSTAMLASAVALAVVQGFAALVIVRNRPSELGLRPNVAADERRAEHEPEVVEWGFPAGQALRTPAFWFLSLGLLLFMTGQGAVNTLGVDFFESRGVAIGAQLIAASAILRTLTRLPVGLSLSRVTKVYAVAVAVTLSQGVALGSVVTSTLTPGLAVFVLLWGLGGAFAPMLEPLLITRVFGVKHFGAVSGTVAMIAFGGQIFGSIGGAWLFDVTGSYTLSFWLYALGFAAAGGLFTLLATSARSAAHRTRAETHGFAP
jgi:predicted MFS family arabinose efflux permease